jgi:hypothetical protein
MNTNSSGGKSSSNSRRPEEEEDCDHSIPNNKKKKQNDEQYNDNVTESRSLNYILGGPVEQQANGDNGDVAAFLEHIWQDFCAIYCIRCIDLDDQNRNNNDNNSGSWNEPRVREDPYLELIRNGWYVLVDLMV